MLDNQLIPLILNVLNSGLITLGITNVIVQQAAQPTQQGIPSDGTIFLSKVMDHRYGFLSSSSVWDIDQDAEFLTQEQQYESTFQVNALVIQNPTNLTSLTASDLINNASNILQWDSTISYFSQNNVGILRINPIRNLIFMDDKQRFEYSPSFDFVLTHIQLVTFPTPVVNEINPGIYRI